MKWVTWVTGVCIVLIGIYLWTLPSIQTNLFLENMASQVAPSSSSSSSTTLVDAPETTSIEILEAKLDRHKKSLVYMGTKATNTGWYVDTICLKNKSSLLVYGVGAEEDISWDLGLVDTYDATVYLFDPTEKSIRYTTPILEKYARTKPNRLFHTSEGLSDKPGKLTFSMPANPDHVSMRQADLADKDMTRTVTVDVNSLSSWMHERNHEYLDILKIDIEGSEYAVLESLLDSNFVPFTQLLVEYHDRFLTDKSRHKRLVQSLKEAGFHELWSDNGGQEVGYLKLADLGYCQDGISPRSPRKQQKQRQ